MQSPTHTHRGRNSKKRKREEKEERQYIREMPRPHRPFLWPWPIVIYTVREYMVYRALVVGGQQNLIDSYISIYLFIYLFSRVELRERKRERKRRGSDWALCFFLGHFYCIYISSELVGRERVQRPANCIVRPANVRLGYWDRPK